MSRRKKGKANKRKFMIILFGFLILSLWALYFAFVLINNSL